MQLLHEIKKTHGNWSLTANIAKGYDDNITTIIDSIATKEGDTFTEGTASISWYSSEDISNSWLIDTTFYTSKYDDTEGYDVDVYSAGLRKYHKFNRTARVHAGVRIDNSSIAGEGYLRSYSANIGTRFKLSPKDSLSADIRFQQNDELTDIYYGLAGTALRATANYVKKIDKHRIKFYYRYDDENKNDAEGETTFISYSASRHSLSAEWRYQFGAFDLALQGNYRISTYKDPHIFDDETEIDGLRDDTKISFSGEISYQITERWHIDLSATSTNNTSSLERYDYKQNLMSLGISWQN